MLKAPNLSLWESFRYGMCLILYLLSDTILSKFKRMLQAWKFANIRTYFNNHKSIGIIFQRGIHVTANTANVLFI